MARLLLLLLTVACATARDSVEAPGSSDAEKTPVILEDVEGAQALIDSSELAVIGFFKNLEDSEVKDYLSVIKDLPEWARGLSTNSDVLTHYNINCSTVAFFRKVDNQKEFLEIKDSKEIDSTKLYRFLKVNELWLVTEFNSLTAIGIFNSSVTVHLLLFMDKSSQTQQEALKPFKEAAEQLRGKVLCVLVDSTVKSNERVMTYFRVTRAQLPAAAIFRVENDERKVMSSGEISVERLREFTEQFLSVESSKEESTDPDDKTPKTEL